MNRKELFDRMRGISEDLEELLDDAEGGGDQEGQQPEHSVFVMPFADVHKMLNAGLINLFRVGDQIVTKNAAYGPIVWDIIGVNVDKAIAAAQTITLQMHGVIPGFIPYDKESKEFPYGHAHYPSSTIRNWLNVDFLKGFDAENDLPYILETERVTYSSNPDGGKAEITADKFFLLSCSEVGYTGETIRDEGPVYPYYADNPERRIKYQIGDEQPARVWWLRSPSPGYAGTARYVNTSGAQNGSGAYNGDGAAAACVIG